MQTAHWDFLTTLGPDEMTARAETARRMIREQGITCYVPGHANGGDCPWELDLLPLILPAEEWATLEMGLVQRARLLNLLLNDLYGSQHSLRNGWLPPAVAYANPQFIRACQGVQVRGHNYLPFYAADLVRTQDGRWQVMADRAQAPSGIGFAMENRELVSRVLPELLQRAQPRPVHGFLSRLRETLAGLAPQGQDDPTMVVLTPGPYNEAYFEHTYIARMLGVTLVEGADLTVRNRRVFIKTLEGLRSVDVILRCVYDAFCDPLELRGDSLLGVPGLLEAVRAGNVSVANALGSGFVESPALMAFLPSLCRNLLGEEQRLTSIPTWWCGGGQGLRHATEPLEQLSIRPAFSLQGDSISAPVPDRASLEAQLRATPHAFVGQEEQMLSRTPAMQQGIFSSAPFVLRVFVMGDGTSYSVMPGGLVRLTHRRKMASSFVPLAGPNKDAWVLCNDPDNGAASIEVPPVPARWSEHIPVEIPSRTADNLFWLGRYAERLEFILRITRCGIGYATGELGGTYRERLDELAGLMTMLAMSAPCAAHESFTDLLLRLVCDPAHPGGVRALITRIHGSAFAVRDRLSADTWRLLNQLERDLPPGDLTLFTASPILDHLVMDLAAFSGMEMENMTRGHGWLFLDAGRRLERTMKLLGLLQTTLARPPERANLLYEPLLDICDSVLTYRRRYFTEIRLPGVLDLLLLDPSNPRSVAFQLEALERISAELPEQPSPGQVLQLRQRIANLTRGLQGLDLMAPAALPLSELLARMAAEVTAISDLLTQIYFNHIVPRIIQA